MHDNDNRLFYLFSSYLRRHIRGARIEFLQKAYRWRNEISVADLEMHMHSSQNTLTESSPYKNEFVFEEDRLASAFQKLPERRKKLLEYLFIYDLKPVEIAGLLGCSVDYVYHLKRYTLSTLRKALLEDEHEL